MIWPLLVGAGVSLIGGMMQQNSQRRAEREWARRADAAAAEPQIIRNTVDFDQMVKDAEAAGFNPLTVLRAGGMGAYNVQQHPNLHPLPNVQQGVNYMGSALQGVGAMVSNYDYGAAQRQSMEWQLMGAQIENLRADTAMRGRASLGGIPQANVGSVSRQGGGALSTDHLGMPTSQSWTQEIPGVTNPFHEVFGIESNPYFSDIETGAEARYGDYGAIPAAVVTYGADILWNVNRLGNWVHNELGPQVRDVFQSWRSMNTPQIWEPGTGPVAPLSITVGGPNQTGQ